MSNLLYTRELRHLVPEELDAALPSITALTSFSAALISLGWGIHIYHLLSFSQKQQQDTVPEQRYPWPAKQWQSSPTRAVFDSILQIERKVPWGKKGELAVCKQVRKQALAVSALSWHLHMLACYRPILFFLFPQCRQFPAKQDGFWSTFLFSSLTPISWKDFSDFQREVIHTFKKKALEQTIPRTITAPGEGRLGRVQWCAKGADLLRLPGPRQDERHSIFPSNFDGGRWQRYFEQQVALL